MRYYLFLFLFVLFTTQVTASHAAINLSNKAEISILTCSPGDQLYSLFGHTAIRVNDPSQNFDMVFNYGTFDFSTKGFYFKYIKGLLPYYLSISEYPYFYHAYKADKRTIYSQILQLDSISKQQIMDKLIENYKPANRPYLYNFLYDNCTTRARDMINDNTTPTIDWNEKDEHLSFWNLLDQYLNYAPWCQWGIHTILGQPGDAIATPYQYMFLPDYLMYGLDSALYNGQLLVSKRQKLYDSAQERAIPTWYFTPYTIFSLVAILLILICFYFKNNKILNTISVLLYLSTGLLGILILFLGFFTRHPITVPNWNILWANPLNLFLLFFILRPTIAKWVQWYLTLNGTILIITLVIWYFLLPAVSLSSMPIIVLLTIMSFLIKGRKRKHAIK